MAEHQSNLGFPEGTEHGSIKSYLIGFLLSIILTLGSYFSVVYELLSGWLLLGTIAVLAVIQSIVQLFLFLHLGSEEKPRWNLMTFLFMVSVIVIIVFGSVWIMYNLDYRMM